MTTQNIDISKAFSHFFEQKDWKDRALSISLTYGGFNLLYCLASIFMIVPFLGIVCLPIICLAIPVFIAASAWFYGYAVEVAESVANHKHDLLPIKAHTLERFKVGGKFLIGTLVYGIPFILLSVIGVILLVFGINILDQSGHDFNSSQLIGIILILLSVILFLITFVGYIVFFIALPAILREFIKHRSISSIFDFNSIYKYIRTNFTNVLIISGIFFVCTIVLSFLSSFAQFTLFICIGVIVIPLVTGAGTLYLMDVYGVLIGEMMKAEK